MVRVRNIGIGFFPPESGDIKFRGIKGFTFGDICRSIKVYEVSGGSMCLVFGFIGMLVCPVSPVHRKIFE